MTPNLKLVLIAIWVVLPLITQGCAKSRGGPLVVLEVETQENTLDGCMACGCRAKLELELGAEHEGWISFGLARADAQEGWVAAAASSHCGSGAFKKAASDFGRTVGTPYVILELSTTAAGLPAGDVDLNAQLRIQKLSGFDKQGEPVYARSKQKRRLSFASQGEITLPLLIPDTHEQESFGVHEVLVRLQATVLRREPAAAYGMLSLSADVPGAEILLDGGLVGRIAEGKPTLLKNVLVGTREIRVRDFSGREAQRQVVVEKDKTVEAALKVLDLPPARPGNGLVPLGKNPQGHEEYWRVQDGVTLVKIPVGEFRMGSPEGQGEPDERPQHPIYVSEFLIDKTEVTWRQFRKFAEATATPLPPAPLWGTPDDYPASFVVWKEAKEYCAWAGGRLPTEAEWEKAARGTDGRTYSWGSEWDPERCNSLHGGPHRPESVGSYPGCVSPYGVLDMSGSVWEWCADWYDGSYYAESPPRNPMGPASGSMRVLRGAAWISPYSWLRTAFRYKGDPAWRNVNYGFRCAQDAPE
jgi:formylglycine-generating enzyme required for sulfatase activity